MSENKGRQLRVLVVDDQESVCAVVADVIRYAGHEVAGEARDGQEAVERARQLQPDVVVMDVQMPRLNGDAAMETILKEKTARQVVLMSGEWQSLGLTREGLLRRGATAFLEKPFSVTELFAVLDRCAPARGV